MLVPFLFPFPPPSVPCLSGRLCPRYCLGPAPAPTLGEKLQNPHFGHFQLHIIQPFFSSLKNAVAQIQAGSRGEAALLATVAAIALMAF